MDELKKYLRKHEASMEVDEPNETDIWERIEAAGRKTQRKTPFLIFIRYATAACIVAATVFGILWLTKTDTKDTDLPLVVKKDVPVHNETVPVLNDQVIKLPAPKNRSKPSLIHQPVKEASKTEDGYEQLVNYQLEQLRTTPIYVESPGYFTDFKLQVQQMDEDEVAMKNDIKMYGLNDRLMENLVNIYEQKLNLLKNLQKQISRMNKSRKEVTPGEQHPYYLTL